MMKYNRILLKLSGEALLGKNSYGIDNDRLVVYAEEIKEIHDRLPREEEGDSSKSNIHPDDPKS